MNETQDERLARLTELARGMWPNSDDLRVSPRDGAKPFAADVFLAAGDGSHYQLEFKTYHPLALDALDAALVVLADSADDTAREASIRECVKHEFERAEAAERELAILRGHCRSIAARWEDRGTPTGHRRDERWEWQEQVKRCAAELLAALDGTP